MRPATLAVLAALLLALFVAAAVQLFVLADRSEDRPGDGLAPVVAPQD